MPGRSAAGTGDMHGQKWQAGGMPGPGHRARPPALLSLWLLACAGAQQTPASALESTRAAPERAPAPPPASPLPTQAEAARQAPLLCGVARTEAALADMVSSEVGLGLLWLAGRDVAGRQHARASVRHALELTHCMLAGRDPGFQAALGNGHPALERWLDTHLGAADDGPVLLAAGTAYFASLLTPVSSLDAMFDVPIALTLLQRAVALDATAQDGLGLLLLGAHDCYVPAPLGGKPQRGSARLRRVAALPGALRPVAMTVEAELCAVGLQDHSRFVTLLQAVLDDDDGRPPSPFDATCRGRARQLMNETQELFLE